MVTLEQKKCAFLKLMDANRCAEALLDLVDAEKLEPFLDELFLAEFHPDNGFDGMASLKEAELPRLLHTDSFNSQADLEQFAAYLTQE